MKNSELRENYTPNVSQIQNNWSDRSSYIVIWVLL